MNILKNIGLIIIILIISWMFWFFEILAVSGGVLSGLFGGLKSVTTGNFTNNQPNVLQRQMYNVMKPYPSANINSPYLTKFY